MILLYLALVCGIIFVVSFILLVLDIYDELSIKALLISMMLGLVFLIWGLFTVTIEATENELDSCLNVNGKYVVIGTETTYIMTNNVMMPTEVDVYGCVK